MLCMMRSCVAGLAVVAAALLAGCGGEAAASVDPAAAKACALLATAENQMNDAVWQFIVDGSPKAGSAAARAASAAYPSLVSDASDAAPAALAPEFSELKRLALLFAATGSNDSGVALELQKDTAVSACEAAGVDMQITNPRTGKVE